MFDDTLISIHAPTRGATILCNHRGLVFGFQSTLPREERLSFPCNISFHLIFQSTLPREERQTMRKLTIAELNFNPRSHERSDHSIIWFSNLMQGFQSTLPREERPVRRYSLPLISVNFNPRSHERSDTLFVLKYIKIHNFNPRSHERSDAVQHKCLGLWSISIHAPTRGATDTL